MTSYCNSKICTREILRCLLYYFNNVCTTLMLYHGILCSTRYTEYLSQKTSRYLLFKGIPEWNVPVAQMQVQSGILSQLLVWNLDGHVSEKQLLILGLFNKTALANQLCNQCLQSMINLLERRKLENIFAYY